MLALNPQIELIAHQVELRANNVLQLFAGYDVVLARRSSRAQDAMMKRSSAMLFYRLFNLVSDIKIPDDVGDFRLMDRKVLNDVSPLSAKFHRRQ